MSELPSIVAFRGRFSVNPNPALSPSLLSNSKLVSYSSSFELVVESFMQGDVHIYRPHCVSAHARFASLQLDWGHHDG